MFSQIVTRIRANQLRSPVLAVAAGGALLCSVAIGALLCCMVVVGLLGGSLADIPAIPVTIVFVVAVVVLLVLTRAMIRSLAPATDDSA